MTGVVGIDVGGAFTDLYDARDGATAVRRTALAGQRRVAAR